MKTRFVPLALCSMGLVLATNAARADQVFPSPEQKVVSSSCRVGATGVTCTHFEGYIFVRRGDGAAPASERAPEARSEAAMGERRIYLPVDAEPFQ